MDLFDSIGIMGEVALFIIILGSAGFHTHHFPFVMPRVGCTEFDMWCDASRPFDNKCLYP